MPASEIRVDVRPENPGEFLACCGLLELADRLWGAEGWFEGGAFIIRCATEGATLREVLEALVHELPVEVTTLPSGIAVKPLIAPLRLRIPGARPATLLLDAWMTLAADRKAVEAVASPPWNFWSGQQTSMRIWRTLSEALGGQIKQLHQNPASLFRQRISLGGRFGFDPGAAWTALDVGFSPNEQGLDVSSSPAVELLAAVGLQRFRPALSRDRQWFVYATWGRPLYPAVAAAAACGSVPVPTTKTFRGRVIGRGSYAALAYSSPIERSMK